MEDNSKIAELLITDFNDLYEKLIPNIVKKLQELIHEDVKKVVEKWSSEINFKDYGLNEKLLRLCDEKYIKKF